MNKTFSASSLMNCGAQKVFLVARLIGFTTEKVFSSVPTISLEGKESFPLGVANQQSETGNALAGSANERREPENRVGGFAN